MAKPASIYTVQVKQMNEVAEKSGKVFCIKYCMRINPVQISYVICKRIATVATFNFL